MVCVKFLNFGVPNFSFPFFRKKLFPFFYLIFSTPVALKDFKFQTLFLLGKVPFPYAFLMVDFDFVRQECPSISFFFARLGVYLEYSSSWGPQADFSPWTLWFKLIIGRQFLIWISWLKLVIGWQSFYHEFYDLNSPLADSF